MRVLGEGGRFERVTWGRCSLLVAGRSAKEQGKEERSEQDRVRGGGGERTGARKEYNHAASACMSSQSSFLSDLLWDLSSYNYAFPLNCS